MEQTLRGKIIFLFCAALVCGIAIGYVDSRRGWDDTGITAGAVFLSSAILGGLLPSRAWMLGMTIGGCVLVIDYVMSGSYGSVIAVGIGLAGAYLGAVAVKKLRS